MFVHVYYHKYTANMKKIFTSDSIHVHKYRSKHEKVMIVLIIQTHTLA